MNSYFFETSSLIFIDVLDRSVRQSAVAESVAFIMADNLEGRKQIISIVRDYYGKRSGVAHGGNNTISDSELHTLINIVGSTITVVIDKLKEFSSQKELMIWIEEMKLK